MAAEDTVLGFDLAALRTLDLNQLLVVQTEVTRLIQQGIAQLQEQVRPYVESGLEVAKSCSDSFSQQDEEKEDFILTQLSAGAIPFKKKGSNATQLDFKSKMENSYVKSSDLAIGDPNLSSPLRGSQNTHRHSGILRLNSSLDGNEINNALVSVKQENTDSHQHLLTERPVDDVTAKYRDRVDFNTNPITNKSWILEDFKPNPAITSPKRGRKRQALEEAFHTKIRKTGSIISGTELSIDLSAYEFENLRYRSKSPPGYGRLDFPNTQERVQDKERSQEILHSKTKHRFLSAVNNKVPPYEREFIFKNDLLNEMVDNNLAEWDAAGVSIYSGRR